MPFFPPLQRPGVLLAVVFLALPTPRAAEPIPAGWFEWPMLEPASGSALDVSGLNQMTGGKLGRIAVRDGKFTSADGQPLRFWGSNLSAAECFPPTLDDARTIARRLAKGGVNIARLHHLDNPWAVDSAGSIWPAGRPEHRELDAEQLDKLHRLIATLRDHGIYSNLNLKVSKTLVPADGFADTVAQLPQFQKRVDIFNRRMIELQKDYARRLLNTRNPYTGLTPAQDPAIAIVEINNENSLLGFWTRDLGRGLDKLPQPFRRDLEVQWNVWLARRYPDSDALRTAWASAPVDGTDTLLRPEAAWHPGIDSSAEATVVVLPEIQGLEIRVSTTTGIAHHVQVSTFGLPVADGAVYTVEFQARADQPRKLGVGVSADDSGAPGQPWRSLGLLETVDLGAAWETVSLTFPAHSVGSSRGQLSFSAGQSTGTISIKDLRLGRDAPGAGLQPGESASTRTVPIPTKFSARQWADWIAFLAETERAFAEEMRSFLRDELHVQAPIVCSQVDYGGLIGLNRERSMDFADTHAYWQHPDFIGADWDPANWVIRNSPQLAEFGSRAFGELGNLALLRVAGKPFTVSEYDHPAPGEFVCEMYPTLATFAARQDWDIVYPFCISAYGPANPTGRIRDFFDQMDHPAKWGQAAFAALSFRRAHVPPAPAGAELHLGAPLWAEQPHADVLWRQLIDGPLDFLNVRYQVSDQPGADGARARLVRGRHPTAPVAEPVRLLDAPHGRVYVVDSDQSAAAVGFIGGASIEAGALRVDCPRFGRDFASVTAVSLDEKPLRTAARVLVTVVARAHNHGMKWNDAHTSVGTNWGEGPTIAERVPAKVTLAGLGERKVYALAPDGTRAVEIVSARTEAGLIFRIEPAHRTLHYEVVAAGSP